MPTFAADQDANLHDDEADYRVRDAWAAYRIELAELQGREYEKAESAAWDRLQHTLAELGS